VGVGWKLREAARSCWRNEAASRCFGQRSGDLRFGVAKFSHKAELIEFHRLLLPALDELACAGRDPPGMINRDYVISEGLPNSV
jgi:hypothetical protein